MSLQVEQRKIEPDVVVLEMVGRMAMGRDTQRLEMVVAELKNAGTTKVVMDLTKVDYTDSAGLGVLAYCLATLKNSGGGLHLANPTDRVKQVLDFTHMSTLLPIYPTVQAAAEAFGKAAGA
jgi:anti-sigma B factor antagonist